MDNELVGLTVLITRPQPQAERLATLITAHGGHCKVLPCIAITAPPDFCSLKQASECLTSYDLAIFISPNAVEKACEYFAQHGLLLPKSLAIGCVGEGTAKALTEHSLKADFYPKQRFNSEELLALPELQVVQSKHIVLFKGVGGKTLLSETLVSRGAKVDEVICYQRICPAVNVTKLTAVWHHIDVVIATSQEILTNLQHILGQAARQLLATTTLLVISHDMAQMANQLGCKTVIVAENATEQAILTSLIYYRKQLHGSRNNNSHH